VSTGISTGQGIQALEDLARRELPSSMSYEWTEITYLEKLSANTGMIVFALSVVFVFLVLAALYESWSLPLAVILVVPLCVLSSIAGVAYAKLDINVFTQIGFVVLIGLASKNAILIVEYAKRRREIGEDLSTAIQDACRLRLRPIIMTSFAFILGVVPLVIATGAGFEMRRALGTTVFSGMLGVTFFGLLFTPVFFAVIDRASHAEFWRRTRWSAIASMSATSLRWLRLGRARTTPAAGTISTVSTSLAAGTISAVDMASAAGEGGVEVTVDGSEPAVAAVSVNDSFEGNTAMATLAAPAASASLAAPAALAASAASAGLLATTANSESAGGAGAARVEQEAWAARGAGTGGGRFAAGPRDHS
jgi:multidrug efflux pump